MERLYASMVFLVLLLIVTACSKDDKEMIHYEHEYGTLVDIDGNEYKTITIGNQKWMAQNLRTTRYSNGDEIVTGLEGEDWWVSPQGKYTVYPHKYLMDIDSEQEVFDAYGLLYNFYAVTDGRGLCPEGWRVPSREDVNGLISIAYSIEGDEPAAQLKSCLQVNSSMGGNCDTGAHPRWNEDPNGNYGTNKLGFGALPAGIIYSEGIYQGIGSFGRWWTSSPADVNDAYAFTLYHNNPLIGVIMPSRPDGLSIRCIKD